MNAPSGDQAGSKSAPGSVVSFCRFEPSASTTKMSSASTGPAEKAIRPCAIGALDGRGVSTSLGDMAGGDVDVCVGCASGALAGPPDDAVGEAGGRAARQAAMATLTAPVAMIVRSLGRGRFIGLPRLPYIPRRPWVRFPLHAGAVYPAAASRSARS